MVRDVPGEDSHGDPVLVAGASGFLGRAIVRALARQGRQVRGLVRDSARADWVRADGGIPVVGDVLDRESVLRATRSCRGIVHVAANPPATQGPEDLARRVRVEGARNLVEAARVNRVERLVIGSGYWVYPSQPGTVTEDSVVRPEGEAKNNYDAERVALDAGISGSLEVMVVRPGMVYGDGAWFRPTFDAIRSGEYRTIDRGENLWSFVSLEDTGAGFATVLESGRPFQVYNLVDGHPRPWGEFVAHVAERVHVAPPKAISFEEAVASYGEGIARHLSANRAASSAKLEALGWRPRYPSFPDGVDSLIAEIERRPGRT